MTQTVELTRLIRPRETGRMRFADSMKSAVIVRECKDVLAYLLCNQPGLHAQLDEIAQRYFGPDQRNAWNTWIITLRGKAVLWSDGAIEGLPIMAPEESESS